MTNSTYAERKIRFASTRADSKVTEWRALGSLTVSGPGFKSPVTLRGPYMVTLHESAEPGELRHAEVRFLESLQCKCWNEVLRPVLLAGWLLAAFWLGAAMTRHLETLVRVFLGA